MRLLVIALALSCELGLLRVLQIMSKSVIERIWAIALQELNL